MKNYKLNTEGKRLQWIINELGITPYQFSKELNYKSPDTIYHVINSINGMSERLIENIENNKFEINSKWITKWAGEPFKKKQTKGNYGNEFIIDNKIIYPAILDFYWIKKIAKILAGVAFSEADISYIAEVRICAVEGLEFLFTTFWSEKKEIFQDKYFSIILQPDWSIGLFYDYWRINEVSRRGQNLLDLTKNIDMPYKEQFEYQLYDLLENLENSEIDTPFISRKKYSFVEIYRTDSRLKE